MTPRPQVLWHIAKPETASASGVAVAFASLDARGLKPPDSRQMSAFVSGKY